MVRPTTQCVMPSLTVWLWTTWVPVTLWGPCLTWPPTLHAAWFPAHLCRLRAASLSPLLVSALMTVTVWRFWIFLLWTSDNVDLTPSLLTCFWRLYWNNPWSLTSFQELVVRYVPACCRFSGTKSRWTLSLRYDCSPVSFMCRTCQSFRVFFLGHDNRRERHKDALKRTNNSTYIYKMEVEYFLLNKWNAQSVDKCVLWAGVCKCSVDKCIISSPKKTMWYSSGERERAEWSNGPVDPESSQTGLVRCTQLHKSIFKEKRAAPRGHHNIWFETFL